MYTYTLSPGGNVMTLAGEDACAARGDALNGEWLRSDCRTPGDFCLGELEAGTYSSAYFEPRSDGEYEPRFGAFNYTVPGGWAAYADLGDVYGLTPQSDYAAFDGADCYDCPGTRDTITVLTRVPPPRTAARRRTCPASVPGQRSSWGGWNRIRGSWSAR